MDSFIEPVNSLIVRGKMTKFTNEFNETTAMKQINDYVCQKFHSSLPKLYQILFYDTAKMSFTELENQLHKKISPFSSKFRADILNTTNAPNYVTLFVVDNSPIYSHSGK